MSHTPGPWNYSKGRVCANGSQDVDDRVAEVDRPEDATLIAAAPELLDALRHLLEDAIALGITDSQYSGVVAEARAAIAKAAGR